MKTKIVSYPTLIMASFSFSFSNAQTDGLPAGAPIANGKFSNPFGGSINNITDILNPLIDLIINIGAIVVVFFIIFAGFKMVMAQGDPGKINDAKKMLFWTIIGGLILLGSKVLAEVIRSTVQELGV